MKGKSKMLSTQPHVRASNDSSGFTLVELMIVVAIIGILAAVAIPNYQKYQARARQSEAKIKLAAIYSAETSYASEKGSYSGCLQDIGYQPDGSTHYYTSGFSLGNSTPAAGTCGPSGDSPCRQFNWPPTGGAGTQCTETAPNIIVGGVSYAANSKVAAAIAAAPTAANQAAQLDQILPGGTEMRASSFVAAAVGNISSTPPAVVSAQVGVATAMPAQPAGSGTPNSANLLYDSWVINNAKILLNNTNGI